jgi:hypothetical protein
MSRGIVCWALGSSPYSEKGAALLSRAALPLAHRLANPKAPAPLHPFVKERSFSPKRARKVL